MKLAGLGWSGGPGKRVLVKRLTGWKAKAGEGPALHYGCSHGKTLAFVLVVIIIALLGNDG